MTARRPDATPRAPRPEQLSFAADDAPPIAGRDPESEPAATLASVIVDEAPAPAASLHERAILDGLNDEQREAVTWGEGPLLIIAGAGTGKTQVITRRIAWLIATGRARPEEILALTFTEKAAAELESRVDVLVPMGMTGASISTFHAFADRLVREHAIELGLTSQLRVESRAEILVFLRERLFELGLERYLPIGRPEQHLQELVSLFDRARDDDIAPADYTAFAEQLAATAHDDETRDRAATEREKAQAYARYTELLLAHGRVDFGHQITLALRLLRERAWLRRTLRERFRWVLVDEFQDTNFVQFELIKRLCPPHANLTVVGDDDQSIYRFRGARVENLLGFLDGYPRARRVLLTRNYRSGQGVLDAAHRLIQHNNPARLEAIHGIDKRLRAQPGAPGVVDQQRYATASDEADAVASEIATAIESGERRPRDFAILARAHFSLDPFAAALRARGIRFHRTNTRGLYARPEVLLCLNMLRALADPDDAASVHYALADPLFGVDPVDLARLNAEARRRNRPLLRRLADAADDPASDLADTSREGLLRFLALHRMLSHDAARRPTTELLYAFVSESGWLERLTTDDTADAMERLQNLNKLLTIAKRVSPLLVHDRVAPFIRHLDLLIEAGDDPAAAEVDIEQDVVHLLSAHNAKGLEFPVVYMVQLVEDRFPARNRGVSLPVPPELRRNRTDDRTEHLREERRLFYVGMTRAQERLVFTSAVDYGGAQPKKTSGFVSEALGYAPGVAGPVQASALEALRRHAPAVESLAGEPGPMSPNEILQLSNSQIQCYAECPLKYRFAHVLHVPLGPQPGLVYGLAVHEALRVYYQHRTQGLPITEDDVVTVFEKTWTDEGFMSREHEVMAHERGREAVRAYVRRAESEPLRTVAVEQRFEFRRGNDEVIGRMDRIDRDGDRIVIVDYKTSPEDDPGGADGRARREVKDGQLGLYALAYKETRGQLPSRGEIHFVGTGMVGRAFIQPEHIERAVERLEHAAAGIRQRRFEPRPDTRTCGTCDYARYCPHCAVRAQG